MIIEGDALEKVVRRRGDVGRFVEVGTPIRITRRMLQETYSQICNCVFQYDGNLKTERYDGVQVVLLLSLSNIYQGVSYEEVQKYGSRETSEGSLVSRCPKDNVSYGGPLPSRSTTNIFAFLSMQVLKDKGKVSTSRRKQVTT